MSASSFDYSRQSAPASAQDAASSAAKTSMKCPLCGFEFDAETAVCRPACPLKAACNFVCCPHCGYQAVDASRATSVKILEHLRKAYVRRDHGKTRV